MAAWWEDDAYGKVKMSFPVPETPRHRRVPLTTDAAFIENRVGGRTFALVNRHPHTSQRIYVSDRKAAR